MNKFFWLLVLGSVISLDTIAQPPHPRARPSLDHIALYVKDLKTSMAFYQNILGLDTIPEPFKDGRHAWFSIGTGISLHIIQGAAERKSYYKNQHTCFSVPSVEAFITILKQHTIPWENREGEPLMTTTRVDGVKQIWLQDPDGYWIEINDAR